MKKIIFAALIMYSCSTFIEPIQISETEVELNYWSTKSFELRKGKKILSNSEFTWKSSDNKVGTVDAKGTFTGRTIGKTIVTATSGKSSVSTQINIVPLVDSFVDPVFEFGSTMANLKSKEKRVKRDESNTMLVYNGETKWVTSVIYLFEKDKLIGVVKLFVTNPDNTSAVMIFHEERYPIRINDTAAYPVRQNDNNNISVRVYYDDDLKLNAIYLPSRVGAVIKDSDFIDLLELIKKQYKK